jgi:hypothetical protein
MGIGVVGWGGLPDPPPGPAGNLSTGHFRLVDGGRDVGEGHGEDVGQQEHGALHRAELVEDGEETQAERVGQHRGVLRPGRGHQGLG